LLGKKESIVMSRYHVAKDGKQTGPFEESDVLQRVAEGV